MLSTKTLLSVSALLMSSVVAKEIRFAPRQNEAADDAASLQGSANILIPVNNTITLKETTLVVTVTRDKTAVYAPFTTALVSTVAALETTVSGTPTTLPASRTKVTTVLSQPPVTVFTSAIQAASSICPPPEPTAGPALDPKSDLTWGCKPGFICSPKKPTGCAFWSGLPVPHYVCAAQDCVPAPPFVPARWDENTTGQYPPVEPYFNLDPVRFGLSPSIFDYQLIVEDFGNELHTFSTGDWGTRTNTDSALPTLGVRRPIPVGRKFGSWKRKPWAKAMEKYTLHRRQGISTMPQICFGTCNDAVIEAQSVGRAPALCDPNGAYMTILKACRDCITANTGNNSTKIEDKAFPSTEFSQFEDYCSTSQGVPGNADGGNPQSQLGSDGESLGITEGIAGATNASAVPLVTRTTPGSVPAGSVPTGSSNGTSGGGAPTGTRPGTSPTATGPIKSAADLMRASGLIAVALPLFGAFLFL